MEEMTLEALIPNIQTVITWIDGKLEELGCPMKAQMQIDVALDEMLSNIAMYAYPEGQPGTFTVRFACEDGVAVMTLLDSGIPYNPLEKEDPDITLSAEERKAGGLGIFLVKKTMDAMEYAYADGLNQLTLRKKIG